MGWNSFWSGVGQAVEDTAEAVQEGVEDTAEAVAGAATGAADAATEAADDAVEAADDAVEGAWDATRTVARGVARAAHHARETADDSSAWVKEQARNTAGRVASATRRGADWAEDKAEDAWDTTKDTVRGGVHATRRGAQWAEDKAEQAWDTTKDTVREGAHATRRGAQWAQDKTEQVRDATTEAVDEASEELDHVSIQVTQQAAQERLEQISSIQKAAHDTAMSVVRNMGEGPSSSRDDSEPDPPPPIPVPSDSETSSGGRAGTPDYTLAASIYQRPSYDLQAARERARAHAERLAEMREMREERARELRETFRRRRQEAEAKEAAESPDNDNDNDDDNDDDDNDPAPPSRQGGAQSLAHVERMERQAERLREMSENAPPHLARQYASRANTIERNAERARKRAEDRDEPRRSEGETTTGETTTGGSVETDTTDTTATTATLQAEQQATPSPYLERVQSARERQQEWMERRRELIQQRLERARERRREQDEARRTDGEDDDKGDAPTSTDAATDQLDPRQARLQEIRELNAIRRERLERIRKARERDEDPDEADARSLVEDQQRVGTASELATQEVRTAVEGAVDGATGDGGSDETGADETEVGQVADGAVETVMVQSDAIAVTGDEARFLADEAAQAVEKARDAARAGDAETAADEAAKAEGLDWAADQATSTAVVTRAHLTETATGVKVLADTYPAYVPATTVDAVTAAVDDAAEEVEAVETVVLDGLIGPVSVADVLRDGDDGSATEVTPDDVEAAQEHAQRLAEEAEEALHALNDAEQAAASAEISAQAASAQADGLSGSPLEIVTTEGGTSGMSAADVDYQVNDTVLRSVLVSIHEAADAGATAALAEVRVEEARRAHDAAQQRATEAQEEAARLETVVGTAPSIPEDTPAELVRYVELETGIRTRRDRASEVAERLEGELAGAESEALALEGEYLMAKARAETEETAARSLNDSNLFERLTTESDGTGVDYRLNEDVLRTTLSRVRQAATARADAEALRVRAEEAQREVEQLQRRLSDAEDDVEVLDQRSAEVSDVLDQARQAHETGVELPEIDPLLLERIERDDAAGDLDAAQAELDAAYGALTDLDTESNVAMAQAQVAESVFNSLLTPDAFSLMQIEIEVEQIGVGAFGQPIMGPTAQFDETVNAEMLETAVARMQDSISAQIRAEALQVQREEAQRAYDEAQALVDEAQATVDDAESAYEEAEATVEDVDQVEDAVEDVEDVEEVEAVRESDDVRGSDDDAFGEGKVAVPDASDRDRSPFDTNQRDADPQSRNRADEPASEDFGRGASTPDKAEEASTTAGAEPKSEPEPESVEVARPQPALDGLDPVPDPDPVDGRPLEELEPDLDADAEPVTPDTEPDPEPLG